MAAKIPARFVKHPSSREFLRWAVSTQPRHRELKFSMFGKDAYKVEDGGTFFIWKRLLDFLVRKGWPDYVMLWTSDGELMIFEKYQLQGVKNELRRSRIC